MKKLNITEAVLDKLGFSEYWDENGTSGTRTLQFGDGERFQIVEQEEMDDSYEGYSGMVGSKPEYVSQHFFFLDKNEKNSAHKIKCYDLFFLHEMYLCVKEVIPGCLEEFVSICESVNMKPYIDSYISFVESSGGKNETSV
jgi:hypothetical protein